MDHDQEENENPMDPDKDIENTTVKQKWKLGGIKERDHLEVTWGWYFVASSMRMDGQSRKPSPQLKKSNSECQERNNV